MRVLTIHLLAVFLLSLPALLLADPSTHESFSEEGYILSNRPSVTDQGAVAPVCGTVSGTRFNLEPRDRARAQHTTSIDFLRNRVSPGVDLVIGTAQDSRPNHAVWGAATAGYYVSRDSDCAPEFEGPLGIEAPVVAADPVRDAVVIAGEVGHVEADPWGRLIWVSDFVQVYRTTGATLLSPSLCADGTHTGTQPATCWPLMQQLRAPTGMALAEPSLAIDERSTGTGAGYIYVAATRRDAWQPLAIVLLTCAPELTPCVETTIPPNPSIFGAWTPHVAVRPDGVITVVHLGHTGGDVPPFIVYTSCLPQALPQPPTCQVPTDIGHVDGLAQPVLVPPTQAFALPFRPQHAHRMDANGIETYVVWDACSHGPVLPNSGCPDITVVLVASRDNGATWSSVTCVACGAGQQFSGALSLDRSRHTLTIALYSTAADPVYQHRLRMILYQIPPGPATPDRVVALPPLTTLLDDPSGDPTGGGFGTRIGIASRGTGVAGQSRTYVHYVYHNIQSTFSNRQFPDPNNHVSRYDY